MVGRRPHSERTDQLADDLSLTPSILLQNFTWTSSIGFLLVDTLRKSLLEVLTGKQSGPHTSELYMAIGRIVLSNNCNRSFGLQLLCLFTFPSRPYIAFIALSCKTRAASLSDPLSVKIVPR